MPTLDLLAPTRVLVVVNEPVPSDVLHVAIRAQVHDARGCEVLLVAPALNSRSRHWLSDEGHARRTAYRRLGAIVDGLSEFGVEAEGIVGDADPIQAIADALAVFPADSVLIATRADHSRRLERELVARAAEVTSRPVTHVVVDDEPDAVVRLPLPTPRKAVRPAA